MSLGGSSTSPNPEGGAASLSHYVAQTFATALATVGLGFLTTIVIARGLGPQGKGVYDLSAATGTLLTILLGFSLPTGVTYVVARRRADSKRLLNRLVPLAILQTGMAIGLLAIVSATQFSAALIPSELGTVLVVPIAVLVGAGILTGELRAIVQGHRLFAQANWRDLVIAFTLLLFASAAVGLPRLFRISPSPLIVVWAAVGSDIVGLVLYFSIAYFRSSNGTGTGLGAAVRFAVPAHVANVAQFLNYRADLFFVGYFVGLAGVGLYALAVSLAQLVWLISTATSTVVLPHVASASDRAQESAATAARAARLTFAATVAAAGMLALVSRPAIRVVFGAQFVPAQIALLLLLPGITALGAARVISAYFAGIGRPGLNAAMSIVGLVITVPLDLLLIPSLGIEGAAIASSLSYIATAIGTFGLFAHTTRIRVRVALIPDASDAQALFHLASSLRRPRKR